MHALTAQQTETLRSCKGTLCTTWRILEHQCLLCWSFAFPLNLNHSSSKKKKNLSGSRIPLALESWNHLHYQLLASLSARKSNCMAVILCWCSLESFVALWAEDFDTPGWTALWCKDFLELVCVHTSVWYIFSEVMTVLYFLSVFPLCCVVLFTWHYGFLFLPVQYNQQGTLYANVCIIYLKIPACFSSSAIFRDTIWYNKTVLKQLHTLPTIREKSERAKCNVWNVLLV